VFRTDFITAMKLPDSAQLGPDDFYVLSDPWRQEWEKGVQVPANLEAIPEPAVRTKTFQISVLPAAASHTHVVFFLAFEKLMKMLRLPSNACSTERPHTRIQSFRKTEYLMNFPERFCQKFHYFYQSEEMQRKLTYRDGLEYDLENLFSKTDFMALKFCYLEAVSGV
ncbi:hypothetical protein XENOCAPTIV_003170, partial [Xenoophorus captivus]